MRPLNTLSLGQLRRRAGCADEPLHIRFYRNWNRWVGNDGFVVTDGETGASGLR
jgi:hypothetical protein